MFVGLHQCFFVEVEGLQLKVEAPLMIFATSPASSHKAQFLGSSCSWISACFFTHQTGNWSNLILLRSPSRLTESVCDTLFTASLMRRMNGVMMGSG
jgi:hypothetical protein